MPEMKVKLQNEHISHMLSDKRKKYVIRSLRKCESALLKDFLYEAIFIPEGVKAPEKDIVEKPELRVYTDDFGSRNGDNCLVADFGGKTAENLKEDNRKIIEGFSKAGEQIILIDTDYESPISDLFEENEKMLRTERLILRRWEDIDAEDLYKYASDPDVDPIAGWPPHQSIDESRDVIKNVLSGKEAYAICSKEDGKAIGAIELKLNGHTDMTDRDDECEMGYWLGKPFWGQGIMPEAVKEMLRHAFEDLAMQKVWIGYYEGNNKSKRVQEKCGFKYQGRSENVDVPLMHEKRTGHVSLMTKEDWMAER